jgi:hypothetical protein
MLPLNGPLQLRGLIWQAVDGRFRRDRHIVIRSEKRLREQANRNRRRAKSDHQSGPNDNINGGQLLVDKHRQGRAGRAALPSHVGPTVSGQPEGNGSA